MYCLLLCRTRLGTVHIPYPWRGNSYSNSSNSIQERRGRCSSSSIICIVSVKQRITNIHVHHQSLTNIPIIIIVLLYILNIIIYNNQQQQEKQKQNGKECYYLLYCSSCSTIRYMNNCRTITYYMYIHDKKSNMSSINELY